MVRIGMVGSGFMAETHLAAYRSIDGADVVAVAAPNTAEEFVAEAGLSAETYGSAEELMDEADVDALDVCSPTPTHRPVVTAAAERGIDAFCEKPIAGNLEDAQVIADVAENAGITLMVGHVLRFFPQYERARDVVEDGGIGDPGVARARRLSPFPSWGHDDWYADRGSSGGVLVDLAIHDLDYVRWVFGEVDRVFARRSVWEEGEHGHVTLRFENGAAAYVDASWGLPPGQELTQSFELAGSDGLVEFDGDDAALTFRTAEETQVTNPVAKDGYRRQLEAFVESVETRSEPSVTAEDAIAALRLSLAANRSAETGRPVAPEEVSA
jgi:predicted dehydrogenase